MFGTIFNASDVLYFKIDRKYLWRTVIVHICLTYCIWIPIQLYIVRLQSWKKKANGAKFYLEFFSVLCYTYTCLPIQCSLMYPKKCLLKIQSHENWNAAAEIIWTHCESACCHRCCHERYVGKEFHSFSTTKIIWFALVLKSRNDGFDFFSTHHHKIISKSQKSCLFIACSYIEFRNDFEIMGHVIKTSFIHIYIL